MRLFGRRRAAHRVDAALACPVLPGDVAWALGSLCNLHHVAFDAALALQRFPPPHTVATLTEAACAAGLACQPAEVDVPALARLPLPCLVLVQPAGPHAGATVGDAATVDRPTRLALLARLDADRVLYFDAGSNVPTVASRDEFAGTYTGVALVVVPAAAPVQDPDPGTGTRRFDFRWFVPELMRHRRVWRDVLVASLFIQLIALAVPLCSQIVIDKVIVHETTGTLAVIAAALFLLVLFSAGFSWIRQYLVSHTGNRVDAVLGMAIFSHLFTLPPRYFQHRPTGVVAARLHGVETIREFLSGAAVTLVLDCPFLVIFLALMLAYSAWLTLVTVAIIAALVLLGAACAPLFQRRLNQQFLLGARNQAFLTEYIAGIETVKALQMEPQLRRRYEDYLASYLQSNFATRQLANTYNTLAGALDQLMSGAILCLGAWLVMRNPGFTIGMLVAFQMFASRVSQPLLRMVGLWQQFQQASIAVQRLADVMNAPAEPQAALAARRTPGEGRIEFAGVGFRYGEDRPWLLRNLAFTIEPGQCIAVLGASGSGKSTLSRLLQGFEMPQEGAVTLDGRNIRHLGADELRAYFGVVPQDSVLFSGTVHDNLVLANPLATSEEVVEACRLAGIHEGIAALPDGYHTALGERGSGLSGGQKQRIAIARALLKRPRVLIFDEATSNLDGPTAEQIARTIATLRGKVTILFITHHVPRGLVPDAAIRIGTLQPVRASAGS